MCIFKHSNLHSHTACAFRRPERHTQRSSRSVEEYVRSADEKNTLSRHMHVEYYLKKKNLSAHYSCIFGGILFLVFKMKCI